MLAQAPDNDDPRRAQRAGAPASRTGHTPRPVAIGALDATLARRRNCRGGGLDLAITAVTIAALAFCAAVAWWPA